MSKYILETAGNIDWMALFALLTFMFIFLLGAYLAFKKDSGELRRLSELPLSDDTSISNNS